MSTNYQGDTRSKTAPRQPGAPPAPEESSVPKQGLPSWLRDLIKPTWPMWVLLAALVLTWLSLPVIVFTPRSATLMIVAACCALPLLIGLVVITYRTPRSTSGHTSVFRNVSLLALVLFVAYIALLASSGTDSREAAVSSADSSAGVGASLTSLPFWMAVTSMALVVVLFYWCLLATATGQFSQPKANVEALATDNLVRSVLDSFRAIQGMKDKPIETRVASMKQKRRNLELVVRVIEPEEKENAKGETISVPKEKRYLVTADRQGKILFFEEQPKKS